jgi:predicted phage terminase large subunit-like protein
LASNGGWVPAAHLRLLSLKLCALARREIRRLLVMMPPRHGKSSLISEWFPVWYLGWNPDHRVILTSYESDYAAEWSRKVRDHLDEWGPSLFGIRVRPDVSSRARWSIDDHAGGMYAQGAGGAITGKGADLLIVDDPIKNDQDARSEAFRKHQWEWLQSTALSRLEPNGVAVIIMTSWHLDDIGQRIQAGKLGGHDWTILKLPAVAEVAEPAWPDGMGRAVGDALWPERFDADALANLKAQAGRYWWSALYQQTPIPAEGALFKAHWFSIIDTAPDPATVSSAIRFWDCASTQDGGDWTAGVLLLHTTDGRVILAHTVRAQVGPGQVDQLIRDTAAADAKRYGIRLKIREEEEGGSAGKAVTYSRKKTLAAFDYAGRRATGPKEVRWQGLARYAELHGIALVRGGWTDAFLDELCAVPHAAHDDQADAAAGAYAELEAPTPTIREVPIDGYW